MARLGISVYPEHSSMEEIQEYISLAARYGFKRIFSCLLSVGERSREEIIEEYSKMIAAAHEHGMEVILDVAPFVFERLGIT